MRAGKPPRLRMRMRMRVRVRVRATTKKPAFAAGFSYQEEAVPAFAGASL